MRLSDAIRLGAMLRPQGFGGLWSNGPTLMHRGAGDHRIVHSCALGAAYDALGCGYNGVVRDAPVAIREWLAGGRLSCPVCGVSDPSGLILAHLNDQHRWTREAIAAFVETVEPADDRSLCPTAARGGVLSR